MGWILAIIAAVVVVALLIFWAQQVPSTPNPWLRFAVISAIVLIALLLVVGAFWGEGPVRWPRW